MKQTSVAILSGFAAVAAAYCGKNNHCLREMASIGAEEFCSSTVVATVTVTPDAETSYTTTTRTVVDITTDLETTTVTSTATSTEATEVDTTTVTVSPTVTASELTTTTTVTTSTETDTLFTTTTFTLYINGLVDRSMKRRGWHKAAATGACTDSNQWASFPIHEGPS
ncbi:hypothetical protein PG993_012754 [Apiospora rasikravindrae]|uniref:Uncharacterized protein n=1 Tax=Apiospora rasikravindrae TaxID=990691 RepID=A0ABR1RVP2_9PEZI